MSERPSNKRLSMTLSDRLGQEEGWVYLTGMQALVRLPIEQAKRDKAAGLNTGGYISGYRGSPIGRYDIELWAAEETLKEHNIVFQPGVNEDLAATASWGAQQVGLFPGARVDGVFSIWYGKAPGMDRSMDAIRHANLAGTSEHGGSIMLVGDDHGAKSSTVACSSDYNFVSVGIPLLSPASAQEVLDFGLIGIAMSRHTSTIVGLKLVTDVVEGGGSVSVGRELPKIIAPMSQDDAPSIQPYTPCLEQERLLWDTKVKRALEFCRANQLNKIEGSESASIGIVAAGKAWQDLVQALSSMGYSDGKLGNLEVRLLKIGMVWPLDNQVVSEFAQGLETIIIVEEKRPIIEDQLRAHLYESDLKPRLVGKTFGGQVFGSESGDPAFPMSGEIDPNLVTQVLSRVANEVDPDSGMILANQPPTLPADSNAAIREPAFCAGCPHGRSTQVIDGSRALAGIGCHTIAMLRDPKRTNSVSHMGGEGAGWMGQFHFTDEPHVFTNMGDGTYFHSGLLAIRAAIAAKAPITYKLLYNGFVSMTGGQPMDGDLTPEIMIAQLKAEGVKRIAWVVDDLAKHQGTDHGDGVTIHDRTEISAVQLELREIPEVTVLIFDQPCATERRRLRKRGIWEDPDKRVFINPAVCEGCGDCSTVSQCMAIEPLETEFGRKRQINQSSCNKDFSCVEGFCPSFVSISGATPRKPKSSTGSIDIRDIPLPTLPDIHDSWSVLVSGIGGSGVVTTGQILAVAAHADGYFSSNLDITGMAQKYGAVHSHIKISNSPDHMRATRIATGEADCLIGCDLVVAAGDDALSMLKSEGAVAVTDTTIVPTSEFSQNPDWFLDASEQLNRISKLLGKGTRSVDAQTLAEKIIGDRIFANMALVGATWQQGGIPLSLESIHRAIELNGEKVDLNKQAFDLGRLAIADPVSVSQILGPKNDPTPDSLEDIRKRHVTCLEAYGVRSHVDRYNEMMERVSGAGWDETIQFAVAKGHFKLLAAKDEWEVARLFSTPDFKEMIGDAFEGSLKLSFHLGGWPIGGIDKKTGRHKKRQVGSWMLPVFRLMARCRGLRGTIFDPFRNGKGAKLAAQLLNNYESDIYLALDNQSEEVRGRIFELLSQPEFSRGYGHIREDHAHQVDKTRSDLRRRILGLAKNASRAKVKVPNKGHPEKLAER